MKKPEKSYYGFSGFLFCKICMRLLAIIRLLNLHTGQNAIFRKVMQISGSREAW